MAQTQAGGAYLSADKKTWHDANGNVIPSPLVNEKETQEEPVVLSSQDAPVASEAAEALVDDKGKGKKKDK